MPHPPHTHNPPTTLPRTNLVDGILLDLAHHAHGLAGRHVRELRLAHVGVVVLRLIDLAHELEGDEKGGGRRGGIADEFDRSTPTTVGWGGKS